MYGGQAVLEGVMIKGQHHFSVAVRRPDGTIALQCNALSPLLTGLLRRVPLVRGIVVLAEILILGMRALSYSANVGMKAEGEELSKGAIASMIAVSIIFGIALFFVGPVLASKALEGLLGSDFASNAAEGIIRLITFLGYVWLIGRMGEIKRVFM